MSLQVYTVGRALEINRLPGGRSFDYLQIFITPVAYVLHVYTVLLSPVSIEVSHTETELPVHNIDNLGSVLGECSTDMREVRVQVGWRDRCLHDPQIFIPGLGCSTYHGAYNL